MVASVDEVLKREFGKSQGLTTLGVKVLDPCVGTGNFIVNIIKHIASRSRNALREKYAHDLFCNEVALLPYYIASINIEHEYYDKMGEYAEFKGVCFADSLELAEDIYNMGTDVVTQSKLFLVEENTERIEREKAANIMVVIGNPPYNMGQKSESENNKNRPYPVIDRRIKETYAKDSKATLNNKLYDAYVKFFRWAVDRLQGHDGVVCFISNNSFIDQLAFDSMRKHFMQDFDTIYHLDLHGNVRKNPKLSGTTHNIFGIQVGVGITIAVKASHTDQKKLYYYRVPALWTKGEKLDFLNRQGKASNIEWQELHPDGRYNWISEGIQPEFSSFLLIGSKEAKASKKADASTIFKTYSLGVATNRDVHAYSFDQERLRNQVNNFIDIYNNIVDKGKRSNENLLLLIDNTDTRIKWTRQVKASLNRLKYSTFDGSHVRRCIYRPFTQKTLYFDEFWNEERYQQPLYFPNLASEHENKIIIAGGYGRKYFTILAACAIPDLNFYADPAQCFPYYIYAEDGSNRRENITDWALEQFQLRYGNDVTKWDIFHYVYAILQHPQYRERYVENLKRDLPHIPLLSRVEAYQAVVRIGRELMDLHVNYEQQEPYPLTPQEDSSVPFGQIYIVEKMKLTPDRSAVIVNKGLTLAGIPEACYRYRLGNRSALEWVIDQYQVSKDARSGIVSDPNNPDDPEYIVRLVKQVVTVSVKTVELVDRLAQEVTQEDWLEEVAARDGAEETE
jgi:predicted helicase